VPHAPGHEPLAAPGAQAVEGAVPQENGAMKKRDLIGRRVVEVHWSWGKARDGSRYQHLDALVFDDGTTLTFSVHEAWDDGEFLYPDGVEPLLRKERKS
jgi:hypothetical protein